MSTDAEEWAGKYIKAKSDQLNACDLVQPVVVTITNAVEDEGKQQPIILHIDGGHQPYKPNLTFRRLLCGMWGKAPRRWIGRKLKLYNEPTVQFGNEEVGGIMISHASHITEPFVMSCNVKRGKKKKFTILPLEIPIDERIGVYIKHITEAPIEKLEGLKSQGKSLYDQCNEAQRQLIDSAFLRRTESNG